MYNSCFKLLVIISIMEWTDNKTKLLIEEFESLYINDLPDFCTKTYNECVMYLYADDAKV